MQTNKKSVIRWTILIVLVLSPMGSSPTEAQNAEVYVRQVRDLETNQIGLLNPAGLAYSPRAGEFIALTDSPPTPADLIVMTPNEAGEVTTIEVRVAASSDDAEESATGDVNLTSSDLKLLYDGGDQKVGMRFQNVAIPQGATIVNAYVQFQADEVHSVATALTIQGEDTEDAPTFIASNGNISSRTRTTAAVLWFPVPWTTKQEAVPDQRTPDMASVIQEIVNRSGWSSDNALVVIITGTGGRAAESYDGDSAGAPLLHVEYTGGGMPSLELYGTFHAMGVVVTVDTGDDPDWDGVASVAYRVSQNGEPYRQGYPPSRVSDTCFVGSLFWLEPGTTYEVRVIFSDPDGGPLDGTTVMAIGSTRAEVAVPAPNNSFYISPTGSGSACSLAVPCALTEGLSQAVPGDEVVLRGGIYYQGDISFPRSGAPGTPIVIRGYDGETAVLDGADPATFTWTARGGGVYHTTVHVAAPHLVTANGERLYPYQSLSDLQSLRWSIPGLYANGTTLYVRLAADADPNSATMVVSRYNRAFRIEQDFIYLLGLTFRHYGRGDGAEAIYFINASDNLVQNCTFAINDTGLVIKQESHRNVIQNNEFYDTVFDWPWDAVKDGSQLETGGLRFSSSTTGRGTVIRSNVFHDYFDGFDVCPSEPDDVINETDVYNNLVYNAGDDGMETDGWCSNLRIWGNTFHDVLSGISLAPARTGPVYAIRNLIYRTGLGNNDHTGRTFKFNTLSSHQSGPLYLFHNTTDTILPDTDGLHVSTSGAGWRLIYSRNNAWIGAVLALTNKATSLPIDLDYDGLWNGNSGHLVRWDDTYYASLADFAAATDQEPHGLSVEPGFADAGIGDYTLNPASNLIDAGVVLPGINDDYVGGAPDIGAFEADAGRLVGAARVYLPVIRQEPQ